MSGQGLCGPGLQWLPQGTGIGRWKNRACHGRRQEVAPINRRGRKEAPVHTEGKALKMEDWYKQDPWKIFRDEKACEKLNCYVLDQTGEELEKAKFKFYQDYGHCP